MSRAADTAVIGGGISGLLVARELLAAGREVTLIERGGLRLEADRLPLADREEQIPSTEHNTEGTASGAGHPWQYGYAFGGSSLLWAGVAPRLLPSDFEMRSRYGIWRDWPLDYDELLPFYVDAERALNVSGGPHPLFPGSDNYPVPPAPPSSVDRLLGPLLEPFGPLAVARPVHELEYPPQLETGAASVEPSFTMLGIARQLVGNPGLSIRERTAAARLLTDGGRVTAVECVDAAGTPSRLQANRVVAATHGIENAALLLRSGLDEPPVGRWLGDHTHVVLDIALERPMEGWSAGTRDSGMSGAWAEGDWRTERASAVVIPFNPGLLLRDALVEALARGETGATLRRTMMERFASTAVVYVSLEDAPREDRFVELSSRRDRLGVPRTRISYPPDSDYVARGLAEVRRGLEQRLRPLGGRVVGHRFGGRGGHMLGTCFAGAEGVVDGNLRHHRLQNLYVTGGSAFPTHSALHPTTTIAALALRLGRHLASK